MQRRRQPEHDTGLHLRLDGQWIDNRSAVDRADDAMHARFAVFDRDFGDLRDIAAERLMYRESRRVPLRQRLAPAELLGGKIERTTLARSFPGPSPVE